MLLKDKTAIIFAATGAVSQGVAREMAAHGAHVHLAGYKSAPTSDFANALKADGFDVSHTTVDATSPKEVRQCCETFAAEHGGIDIVFNGIGGRPKTLGYPAKSDETSLEDFLLPINHIVGSQFLTSREAARIMVGKGSGSILTLSATLSGSRVRYMAGISAACGAVEVMTNSLADEYGEFGIRVNCVRGGGMPETRTIKEVGAGRSALRSDYPPMGSSSLGRPITVEETAKAAVFLVSDLASGMSAQMVTVCAGQFPAHI